MKMSFLWGGIKGSHLVTEGGKYGAMQHLCTRLFRHFGALIKSSLKAFGHLFGYCSLCYINRQTLIFHSEINSSPPQIITQERSKNTARLYTYTQINVKEWFLVVRVLLVWCNMWHACIPKKKLYMCAYCLYTREAPSVVEKALIVNYITRLHSSVYRMVKPLW